MLLVFIDVTVYDLIYMRHYMSAYVNFLGTQLTFIKMICV